jgi:hypothetical protein
MSSKMLARRMHALGSLLPKCTIGMGTFVRTRMTRTLHSTRICKTTRINLEDDTNSSKRYFSLMGGHMCHHAATPAQRAPRQYSFCSSSGTHSTHYPVSMAMSAR